MKALFPVDEAEQMMTIYVWRYQTPTDSSLDPSFWWYRALRQLWHSRKWSRDYERIIKRAVERNYVEFNRPLVKPELFDLLTDELWADLVGFFGQEAA